MTGAPHLFARCGIPRCYFRSVWTNISIILLTDSCSRSRSVAYSLTSITRTRASRRNYPKELGSFFKGKSFRVREVGGRQIAAPEHVDIEMKQDWQRKPAHPQELAAPLVVAPMWRTSAREKERIPACSV